MQQMSHNAGKKKKKQEQKHEDYVTELLKSQKNGCDTVPCN